MLEAPSRRFRGTWPRGQTPPLRDSRVPELSAGQPPSGAALCSCGDTGRLGRKRDAEMASCSRADSQALVGDSCQVVNAGVGSQNGLQTFQTAQQMVRKDDYGVLIHATHRNDFFKSRHIASSELVGVPVHPTDRGRGTSRLDTRFEERKSHHRRANPRCPWRPPSDPRATRQHRSRLSYAPPKSQTTPWFHEALLG
jgi:hypothetical protein